MNNRIDIILAKSYDLYLYDITPEEPESRINFYHNCMECVEENNVYDYYFDLAKKYFETIKIPQPL